MRVDEVIENNKKISEQSLKTATDIERQILSVLTDISETLAMQVDLTANIYGREIYSKEQIERIQQQQMQRQQQMQQMPMMPQQMPQMPMMPQQMPQYPAPVPMPMDNKEKQ